MKTPFKVEETHPIFGPTGMLCRAFAQVEYNGREPVFSLYTDDGEGNGEHIFSVPLAALEKSVNDNMADVPA